MLLILLPLSFSLAKGESCYIQEKPENPLLFKDGDVKIGAIFSIHRGTETQLLEYTEKPQHLICIRFVSVTY